MTELTRRHDPEQPDCWHVHYGDVSVGTIMRRVGQQASDAHKWEWRCGFYPGSAPGEMTNGTASTFDAARERFDAAWQVFLSRRTEADFQAWRDHQEWIDQRYGMWERGEPLPSQQPNSMMRCPCGETFDSHSAEQSQTHVPHITAAHQAREGRGR
jgi:hypothetical protein